MEKHLPFNLIISIPWVATYTSHVVDIFFFSSFILMRGIIKTNPQMSRKNIQENNVIVRLRIQRSTVCIPSAQQQTTNYSQENCRAAQLSKSSQPITLNHKIFPIKFWEQSNIMDSQMHECRSVPVLHIQSNWDDIIR